MRQRPFYPSEMQQIDRLVRAALMQPVIRRRLLEHDADLCTEFNIPSYTWARLSTIQAHTLQEFCRQILDCQIQAIEHNESEP